MGTGKGSRQGAEASGRCPLLHVPLFSAPPFTPRTRLDSRSALRWSHAYRLGLGGRKPSPCRALLPSPPPPFLLFSRRPALPSGAVCGWGSDRAPAALWALRGGARRSFAGLGRLPHPSPQPPAATGCRNACVRVSFGGGRGSPSTNSRCSSGCAGRLRRSCHRRACSPCMRGHERRALLLR